MESKMKKTFLATLCLVSISFFANAEKIVIKNDSKYNISYGTSYPAVANPLGTSISPGQYVIFDLPDNLQSKVYIRRWSWEGAAKNIFTWGKRLYTAVAPNKENCAEFGTEAYRFGKEDVYKNLAVAKVTLNPSLVTEGNIKVVHVENFEEGSNTIQATIYDGLKKDFPGSEIDIKANIPNILPIENESSEHKEELKDLGLDKQEIIEEYNRLISTASTFVANNPMNIKDFEALMSGPASLSSVEAIEVLKEFILNAPCELD
jgi:hypothetical protein